MKEVQHSMLLGLHLAPWLAPYGITIFAVLCLQECALLIYRYYSNHITNGDLHHVNIQYR